MLYQNKRSNIAPSLEDDSIIMYKRLERNQHMVQHTHTQSGVCASRRRCMPCQRSFKRITLQQLQTLFAYTAILHSAYIYI